MGEKNMRNHKVGDDVLVKLSGARIVEAMAKAITESAEGTRLQVSFRQYFRATGPHSCIVRPNRI